MLERSNRLQLASGAIVELTEAGRQSLLAKLTNLSSKALRCLGFAYKEELGEFATYDGEQHPANKKLLDPANYSKIESDLTFVGMVGLRVSSGHAFFLHRLYP